MYVDRRTGTRTAGLSDGALLKYARIINCRRRRRRPRWVGHCSERAHHLATRIPTLPRYTAHSPQWASERTGQTEQIAMSDNGERSTYKWYSRLINLMVGGTESGWCKGRYAPLVMITYYAPYYGHHMGWLFTSLCTMVSHHFDDYLNFTNLRTQTSLSIARRHIA